MEPESLDVPRLNFQRTVDEIIRFIKKVVTDAKAQGVVIGLSGGVDSSLAGALCVKALGKEKILGISMPTLFTPKQDVEDASLLAKKWGIRTLLINIQNISEEFVSSLKCNATDHKYRTAIGNIYARVRMIILYYYANISNYLVVGTGDRCEELIGFFTKYGDGGADFLPIAHLYKTEVRKLAKYIGIPEKISNKPSSPQLYPGHKAIDEIPIDYDQLDKALIGLFDYKLSPKKVHEITTISMDAINKIIKRFETSKHKRSYPPMLARQVKT
jgi:NAD+ synthase